MDIKRTSAEIFYSAVYWALRGLRGCALLFPRRFILWLGSSLGVFTYGVLRWRRKVALENLSLAFGTDREDPGIKRIARDCFRNIGRHFFEAFYMNNLGELSRKISFEGEEHLKKAKEKGKGVLILTAHFGSWELMASAASLFYEPIYVVIKELDFPPLDRLVRELREATGNRCTTKEKSMRRILALLAQNASLGILLDQNIDWKDGVFVNFFGRPACTNKGLALLAMKSGAAVIPVFIFHQGKGKHVIRCYPEIPLADTGDRTKDMEESTRVYTEMIESVVREVPDHWFWVHKRWKTRPECPWPKRQ